MFKNINGDYELDRRQKEQAYKKILANSMLTDKADSTGIYNDNEGFQEAITKQIFPCLVRLKTNRAYGVGFYQHQNWLVTNAHIIPQGEIFETL